MNVGDLIEWAGEYPPMTRRGVVMRGVVTRVHPGPDFDFEVRWERGDPLTEYVIGFSARRYRIVGHTDDPADFSFWRVVK